MEGDPLPDKFELSSPPTGPGETFGGGGVPGVVIPPPTVVSDTVFPDEPELPLVSLLYAACKESKGV